MKIHPDIEEMIKLLDLPEKYEKVLLLRYKENLTFEEIGRVLKVSRTRAWSIFQFVLVRIKHPIRKERLEILRR